LNFLARFFTRTPRQSDPVPEIRAAEPANAARVEIILPEVDPTELVPQEPAAGCQPGPILTEAEVQKPRFTDEERAAIRQRNGLPAFDPDFPTEVSNARLTDPPVQSRAAEVGYRKFILEPIFSMIEYCDTSGVFTRRRVTMRNVIDRGDQRYLQAFCHERNAMRTFRLDRITCLISQDGEVEDAEAFFDEVLATAEVEELSEPMPLVHGPKAAKVSTYTEVRRHLTPAIALLTATARSDDVLHSEEMNRILTYIEKEGELAWKAGTIARCLSVDDLDKIERTIRRLRPTQEDIGEAMSGLRNWPTDAMKRLAYALASTAQADGRIDEIEAELIDELRAAGAREHGFGWDE
jgi:tellurite resistance protein